MDIRKQLLNEDIEIVQECLRLLQNTQSDISTLLHTLGVPRDVSEAVVFEECFKDHPHQGTILHHLYLQLEQLDVQWALERERTFHISLEQYNGRPFEYWVQSISKECYDYWSQNGGTDSNKSLFDFLCALTELHVDRQRSDIPTDMTIAEARAILADPNRYKDRWEQIPDNIPDHAFILPINGFSDLDQFNNERSNTVMIYFPEDTDDEYGRIVQLGIEESYAGSKWDSDRDEQTRHPIFKDEVSELCNHYPGRWTHIHAWEETIRTDEYFMCFHRFIKAPIYSQLTKRGAFEMDRFTIKTILDEQYGSVFTADSLRYDGHELSVYYPGNSDIPPPQLMQGLPYCDPENVLKIEQDSLTGDIVVMNVRTGKLLPRTERFNVDYWYCSSI